MPVKLAKKTGFCFGVRRAVEMAEDVLCKEKNVYSLGSIIHNRQVVDMLSRRGLKVIDNITEAKSGVIVVSSHGISPATARAISGRSLKLTDTTCPFVRKAQEIARALSAGGYRVIIVGDARHPEVRALVAFAGKGSRVIKGPEGLRALRLKPKEKIGILSQTTQSMGNFLGVVKAVINKKPRDLKIFNTICQDAEDRQAAARSLARQVDLMLIVGGRDSANTKRLFEVCKKVQVKSYLIESEAELKGSWFKGVFITGITSGASTPDWVVKRVVKKVNSKLIKERKVAKAKW